METHISIEKTKIVLFRSGGKHGNRDKCYYNESELEIVTRFTYLGVVFSQNGSISKTQQTLARQAQKAVFGMFRLTNKYVGLNPFVMCGLFNKMILPMLTCGCEVLGYHKGDAIERVHHEFLKGLLKMKSTTMNQFVYEEFGSKPLIYERYIGIVKYWFKLLKQTNDRRTKSVYHFFFFF